MRASTLGPFVALVATGLVVLGPAAEPAAATSLSSSSSPSPSLAAASSATSSSTTSPSLAVAATATTSSNTSGAAVSATAAEDPTPAPLPVIDITLNAVDPLQDTLAWVHEAKDHEVPVLASVDSPDDSLDLVALTGKLKGRGNSTWTLAKRPYQLKLSSSRTLLGMPAARTWVLLANHADASLMRNKLAFDLAAAVGLPHSPQSRFVELRVDGEYLGSYLLAEKVEVATNRVDLTHPQGVLTELDLSYGLAEDHWFRTATSGTVFTLKDAVSDVPDLADGPLPADTQAGWDDVRADLDALDVALRAWRPDWSTISSLIDVDSFARYYLVQEVAENPELLVSSVYLWKDGPDDVLHAGPVWDFDAAFGMYDKQEKYGANPDAEYAANAVVLRGLGNPWMSDLFREPRFVQRVNELWVGGVGAAVAALPAAVDAHEAALATSAAANFTRWPILGGTNLLHPVEGRSYAPTYAAEVGSLRAWVTRRVAHLERFHGEVPVLRVRSFLHSRYWGQWVSTGQVSGAPGKRLRLEGLELALVDSPVAGTLVAQANVERLGWMKETTTGRIGAPGRRLRLEALRLRLTGDLAQRYDISYRAYVAGVGWQPWVVNGAVAGTTGQARRVEAVQVRLLERPSPTARYARYSTVR
ncbi:CotH kinase family protein [Oryzobacter telluris]|uniref:CotH kinase family protein n=1 Tax=Oryzobacter telluris TaxID=3149179 RepID=UPI00370D62FB